MKYLLYKQSGELICCLTAEPADLKINMEANQAYGYLEEEVADTSLYYVVENRLMTKPVQPSKYHVFNWQTKLWEADKALAWADILKERGVLLAKSDWVVIKAQETGTVVPEAWLNYRQALRDVTLQTNPLALVWPRSP